MTPIETAPVSSVSQPRVAQSQRHLYRIRFRKERLLRFISHNDLLRAWDRLLRRTGIPLKSTQGFHAKTRISSPIPLALGLEADDEVLDIELTEPMGAESIRDSIQQHLVGGLWIRSVTCLPASGVSRTVEAVEYLCRIDGDYPSTELLGRREALLASPSWTVERWIPGKPVRLVDVRSKLETIAVDDAEIRFRLRVDNGSTVRPEEVLGILGLGDSLREGRVSVVRTRVQIADSKPAQ